MGAYDQVGESIALRHASEASTSKAYASPMPRLVPALIEAQRAFKPARKSSDNPFFKSKYADLQEVQDATYPALWDNGLVVTQGGRIHDGTPVLITRLMHVSGETIESEYPLSPAKQGDPQSFGACVTYARRYALMAALGVAPEDDDGNVASDRAGPKLAPRAPTVTSAPKARAETSSPSAPSAAPSVPPAANNTKDDEIAALVRALNWAQPHATNFLKKTFGVELRSRLSDAQKDECILLLTARAAAETAFPGAK